MRRLAVLLVVLLVVPAVALAADTDPKRRINPSDERKAASIVFKRTDFTAGWRKTTSTNDDDDLKCAYYNPNGSDLTLTGDAEAEFERDGGLASLYSYADVYATAKDAAASWTRTVKPAAVRGRAEAGFLTFAQSPGVAAADLRTFAKLMAERMKVAGF